MDVVVVLLGFTSLGGFRGCPFVWILGSSPGSSMKSGKELRPSMKPKSVPTLLKVETELSLSESNGFEFKSIVSIPEASRALCEVVSSRTFRLIWLICATDSSRCFWCFDRASLPPFRANDGPASSVERQAARWQWRLGREEVASWQDASSRPNVWGPPRAPACKRRMTQAQAPYLGPTLETKYI